MDDPKDKKDADSAHRDKLLENFSKRSEHNETIANEKTLNRDHNPRAKDDAKPPPDND
jgi:hypothetical protein